MAGLEPGAVLALESLPEGGRTIGVGSHERRVIQVGQLG